MIIPPNYSERLLQGEQVQVQVLIDGSDSQVATTALNAANLLGMTLSVGIVTSVFTALVVTRLFYDLYPGSRPVSSLSI